MKLNSKRTDRDSSTKGSKLINEKLGLKILLNNRLSIVGPSMQIAPQVQEPGIGQHKGEGDANREPERQGDPLWGLRDEEHEQGLFDSNHEGWDRNKKFSGEGQCFQ